MDDTLFISVAAQLNGDPCEWTVGCGLDQNRHFTFDRMGRSHSLLPLKRRRCSILLTLAPLGVCKFAK